MLKIQVLNEPAQNFEIFIPEEGRSLIFDIVYISRGDFFVASLYDANTNPLALGLKLVSGIRMYRAFNFLQGDFIVVNSAEYTGDPTMGAWGDSTEFFYLTPAELEQLR